MNNYVCPQCEVSSLLSSDLVSLAEAAGHCFTCASQKTRGRMLTWVEPLVLERKAAKIEELHHEQARIESMDTSALLNTLGLDFTPGHRMWGKLISFAERMSCTSIGQIVHIRLWQDGQTTWGLNVTVSWSRTYSWPDKHFTMAYAEAEELFADRTPQGKAPASLES